MMSPPQHLYLSPHYDDAILSCGGMIEAQRRAGDRVVVLTLCAGIPASSSSSPLVMEYEAEWNANGSGYARRKAENQAVLSRWDVENWGWNTLDAIYRGGVGGPYYLARSGLFGKLDPKDAADVLATWKAKLEQAPDEWREFTIYSPLGVGGHVDHELARRLGERAREMGWSVWFYEDYPYVELDPLGLSKAQARFGNRDWSNRVVMIDVLAKMEAVRGYESQMGRVFGGEKDVTRRLKEFTAETAGARTMRERLRKRLAPDGLRLRIWRAALGFPAHAERIWRFS